MSLQALLDATPDGGTCVIPAGDHTIPEGTGLVVPHGVAAIEFSGATTRQAFNVPAGAVRFIDCEAP